jgi:hypothetical protein
MQIHDPAPPGPVSTQFDDMALAALRSVREVTLTKHSLDDTLYQ